MAKKYIDAEKLRAEIESRKEAILSCPENGIVTLEVKSAIQSMAKGLLSFLDSLQQEQPEDLEKEIDKEWKKCNPTDEGMGVETANIHIEAFDMIAHHFYELGQNSK